MSKLRFKLGQKVYLAMSDEYKVVPVEVIAVYPEDVYEYKVRASDGSTTSIADDDHTCFSSHRKAYDYLIDICKYAVEESKMELSYRRLALDGLRKRKKEALAKEKKA